jgi:phospholipase/carboxylesterase
MTESGFAGIELMPDVLPAKQLMILLHGLGTTPTDLLPLAQTLRTAFPAAVVLLPEGFEAFDGGGMGRQWFSVSGMDENNAPARIASALPKLHALIRAAQDRHALFPPDTALVGFSQGAIMALEFCSAYDGGVGRVIAFAGRFATLPERAPELTTLHLLHGEDDDVIPVEHAHAAFDRLSELDGDATLDLAEAVGHDIPPLLAERAVYRLQTCIPLRTWKQAQNDA